MVPPGWIWAHSFYRWGKWNTERLDDLLKIDHRTSHCRQLFSFFLVCPRAWHVTEDIPLGISVPKSEIEPKSPALKVGSPNHWTTREAFRWALIQVWGGGVLKPLRSLQDSKLLPHVGCWGDDSSSGWDWVRVGSLSLGPSFLRLGEPGLQVRHVSGS